MNIYAKAVTPVKDWFLTLNKRERIMVGGTAILAPLYLLIALGVMPALERYRTLEKRVRTQEQNNTELAQQISELGGALQNSPTTRQRREIERLEQQLLELHTEVGAHLDALVVPEQMPDILRRLLHRHPGITLSSMQNAPAQVITPRTAGGENPEDNMTSAASEQTGEEQSEHLYRQPLLLKLEGSYLDILAYLEKIRSWPEHMFIDSVEIKTQEYPLNTATIQVSSISTAPTLLRGSSKGGL